MDTLEPWIYGPLELIKHAEEHEQANGDFDKHMALIGYDNAIEVSLSTYLQLHPTQRKGAEYPTDKVKTWLTNYHSLLEFFFEEFMKTSGQTPLIAKETVIYYHNLRNKLYHEGRNFVPTERDIQGARSAALYIFSKIFNVKGEEFLKLLPLLHSWTPKKCTFKGKGSDLHKMPLNVGATIFRFKYVGRRYLTINLRDENGRQIARVAEPAKTYEDEEDDAINTYQSSNSVNIKKAGIYLLKINALDTWEIEVEQ